MSSFSGTVFLLLDGRLCTFLYYIVLLRVFEWDGNGNNSMGRESHRNGNTQGDASDVISMLAGFRRHLVGETLINVFHCDITEIRFVGKLVIIRSFS